MRTSWLAVAGVMAIGGAVAAFAATVGDTRASAADSSAGASPQEVEAVPGTPTNGDARKAAAPSPSEATRADRTPSPGLGPGPTDGFVAIGRGLEYGRFRLAEASALGDSLVRVVRIDAAKAAIRVRAASLGDGQARPASGWADGPGAAAVINSSMFAGDLTTSVGYLRVDGAVQNGRWAAQQNSLFVTGQGRFQLANLGCDDRDAVAAAWPTLVQSIRMLGCGGENVWSDQARAWSSALVGQDRSGRALFLHTRSPYRMHALVDLLLAAPLDLVALHYGEGGPEASLYVRGTIAGAPFEEVNVGSYETGFVGDDSNDHEWQLPNVLVAAPKPAGN